MHRNSVTFTIIRVIPRILLNKLGIHVTIRSYIIKHTNTCILGNITGKNQYSKSKKENVNTWRSPSIGQLKPRIHQRLATVEGIIKDFRYLRVRALVTI